MRTCFLHVGTPKTGTTTIQGFLEVNREALAARGLDLPLFPEETLVGGARVLANTLRRETDPAAPVTPSWRWLDRHIATTSGDFCISRESLSSEFLHAPRVAWLGAFFARRGVRVRAVAYVRDTPERINSAYTQHTKKLKLPQTFDRWIAPIEPANNPKFSPWRVFRHVLGADDIALDIRSFDAVKGRLLPDFLEAIGQADFDPGGFDDAPFRNATPGPKAIAAALIVGQGLEERALDPELEPIYGEAFEAAVAARSWNERPFFGPTPEVAARLSALYDPENDRFAQAAWGRPWSACVPRTAKPQNVFDARRASAQDIADIKDLAREALARGDASRRPWRRALAAVTAPFARK